MLLLNTELIFPNPEDANEDGILAIGGDLKTKRLLLAYRNGIFPWFSDGEPIIWWSPNPRMVLYPHKLRVSKSMRKIIRDKKFRISINENFEGVINNCKKIFRPDQGDTWITDEMRLAYIKLHYEGTAQSVEVWNGEELVGGLYGVNIGKVFCGESMFSKQSNTSKLAFIYLVRELEKNDYNMVDCQVYNEHLESLGAEEISREQFLTELYNNRDLDPWDFKT
ncbi:MAG: leucyl/phenylalanyl-tRNA--protein transferase [Flavobacteriales bacterium]|nr:leucyl/phenylalanyl-tRNA--protein transferase [Flavobacteriales bacterium]